MTDTKHTPGPWVIGRDGYNPDKIYADQDAVAAVFGLPIHSTIGDVRGDDRWAQGLANARLIAAAPDLLAACQRALAEAVADDQDGWYAEVRAAIAEATGK